MPLLEQKPRDRRPCASRAVDDDVVHLARAGGDDLAPRLRRLGRADHDDPVAGPDHVVAARKAHLLAADDRGDARVGGKLRVAHRHADDTRVRALVDVELDELHLTFGEQVGLARRRDADRARDRVGGLDLRGDDEVDVELPLPPHLEVLRIRRPDDRRRPPGACLRDHRGDDVGLVSRGAGDQEVGVGDPRTREDAPARPVPLDRCHVVPRRERRQPRFVQVEHRQLVLLVQRLDDRRSDLARADHEDVHVAEVTSLATRRPDCGRVS